MEWFWLQEVVNPNIYNMKKILPILVVIMLLVPSCKKNTIIQLNLKNQELTKLAHERDSIVNQLVASFDELERSMGMDKQEGDATDRIKQDIEHLKDLLDKNDSKYKNLQRIIANSRKERTLFNSRADSLRNSISDKNDEIAGLKKSITNLNTQIDTQQVKIKRLISLNSNQNSKINDMVKKMNTAHFIVGEPGDLKEKEIVVKKGGFLGLFGRVDKLNPQFKRNEFQAVDIRSDTLIPLQGDKVKIVTVHPVDTYNIIDSSDVKTLEITDPERFWAASRYLVVESY